MIFNKPILFFVTVLVAQLGIAQSGASITASVNKKKILIGEPVQLTIEAHGSPGAINKFITFDSIAHFELLEKPLTDSSIKNGGSGFKAVYTITSFDSGHWVIPSFVFSPGVATDSIPIDVIFSDFDPNQEYHDIKDILEVKVSRKKTPWWWYAAGAAVLLGSLLWYLRRRKKPAIVAIPKNLVSPYEEAKKQLEQLEREKPGIKQYHSRLIDIFRLYIFRKKGILSLQKTTDDLIVQLKNLNLDKQQFEKLSQSLRLSDFVKFAKYLPSEDDNRNSFEEIKKAIITIEKTETGSPSFGGS